MSPSHAMIYVSLLRGALIPSHAFTFNIGNRQGRAVSRVQFDTKQSSIDHTTITRSIGKLLTGKLLAGILLAVKLIVTSSSGKVLSLDLIYGQGIRQAVFPEVFLLVSRRNKLCEFDPPPPFLCLLFNSSLFTLGAFFLRPHLCQKEENQIIMRRKSNNHS